MSRDELSASPLKNGNNWFSVFIANSEAMMSDKIYTTFEVSRFCSVDISTVMGWVDDGKLPAYRTPGGHRRIQAADLIAFLEKYRMPVHPALKSGARRVLIVDDDPATVRVLKRLVQREDASAEMEVAFDGFEAGRKVESFSPDLILLDLLLPGLDGFEVCKNIRSGERTRHMKILALSAMTGGVAEKRIRACGADAFVKKPIDLDALRQTIVDLLGISATPDADAARGAVSRRP
jgi:excisionase family DNA binding protein